VLINDRYRVFYVIWYDLFYTVFLKGFIALISKGGTCIVKNCFEILTNLQQYFYSCSSGDKTDTSNVMAVKTSR
jgi:hypothetical protein